jgi:ferredoxin
VRVDVDPKQCEANPVYLDTASDVFKLPYVSDVIVMGFVVPGDGSVIRDAVRLCPNQPLSIEENT